MKAPTSKSLKYCNEICRLGSPLVIAFLAQIGMQLVDTAMLGQLGAKALAVGALGGTIIYTLISFSAGFLSPSGVFISEMRGARNNKHIPIIIKQGILIALILSLLFIAILYFSPFFLQFMKLDKELVEQTGLYLQTLAWGLPSILIFIILRDFIVAFNYSKIVMIISLIAIPINVILNSIFMYGLFGLPELGLIGIGYSTSITRIVMLCFLVAYITSNPRIYVLLRNASNHLTTFIQFKKMFTMGGSTGAMVGLEVGMFLMVTLFVGQIGVISLAAHQIASQCVSVAFAIAFGLSQAANIKVAYVKGANKDHLIPVYTYASLGLGLFCSSIIALLFVLGAKPIINLFFDSELLANQEALGLAINLLCMAAILQYFDSCQAILLGVLRALKDTFVPMLLAISSYWLLGVVSSYLLAFHMNLGTVGIWIGICLGIGASSLFAYMRYLFINQRAFTIDNEQTVILKAK
ncbi:MATE family efflux transporter [Photobacterium leiognathi]|uniref:MATE family efflux transporter n=1 Tax=Photobacterium leiognathi TaxID=553611 RepID=UPI002739C223|nr:MATE family efflux transporter [Photobacterium leiognathi]